MVGKCDIVAVRGEKRRVGILSYAKLLIVPDHAYPCIGRLKPVQHIRKRCVLTAAVRKDELPVRVALRFDRIDQLHKEIFRSLIERNNDGEERCRIEHILSLFCEDALAWQVFFYPVRIDHRFHGRVKELVVGLLRKRPEAVVLKILNALSAQPHILIGFSGDRVRTVGKHELCLPGAKSYKYLLFRDRAKFNMESAHGVNLILVEEVRDIESLIALDIAFDSLFLSVQNSHLDRFRGDRPALKAKITVLRVDRKVIDKQLDTVHLQSKIPGGNLKAESPSLIPHGIDLEFPVRINILRDPEINDTLAAAVSLIHILSEFFHFERERTAIKKSFKICPRSQMAPKDIEVFFCK